MRHLTELQQQVVALRFGAGMSLQETADIMGRSVNAIKNLQHKALGALRRHLEPMGVGG
jgi:RNA polymerase sigma-70 factor (ECF subfamily)